MNIQILKNLKDLNLISNLSTCIRKATHASYSAAACEGAARAHARGGMRRGEKNRKVNDSASLLHAA